MRWRDLVRAVCPNEQQMLNSGIQKVTKRVEACVVGPLKIIQEQRERTLGPCNDGEDSLQEQLKAVLGFLHRDFRHGRLRPDQQIERRHEIDEQLSIRRKRLA